MAKFCGMCGTPLNADGICEKCNPVQKVSAVITPKENIESSPVKNEDTDIKKNKPNSQKKGGNSPKKGKKGLVIALILVILAVVCVGAVYEFFIKNDKGNTAGTDTEKSTEAAPADDEAVAAAQSDTNYVWAENFTDIEVRSASDAIAAVAEIEGTLGLCDAEEELETVDETTVDNTTYYRMQQVYEGIPVYGSSVVLSADSEGNVTALTANTENITGVSTEISVDVGALDNTVAEYYNNYCISYEVDITSIEYNDYSTVIYTKDDGTACVAYDINLTLSGNSFIDNYSFIVDANTAEVLEAHSLVMYSQSSFTYDGQLQEQTFTAKDGKDENSMEYVSSTDTKIKVYYPADGHKYDWYNDNAAIMETWQDSEIPDESAVDIMTNMTKSYEFFRQVLGRDSFDGKGSQINAYFDVTGYRTTEEDVDSDNNAFHWCAPNSKTVFAFLKCYDDNNNEITDYAAQLDVVAHEYTHGIESNISGMKYRGESGALMEAYSDIFGEIVEDYSNDGLDNDCNWTSSVRNLKDPTSETKTVCHYEYNGNECPIYKAQGTHVYNKKYELTKSTCCIKVTANPKEYKGDGWINTSYNYDKGGVHINSTVVSYAAYLMNNGIDGTSQKISTEKLAKLWYNSLFYLHKTSDLAQCRSAVELTARIMLKNKQLTEAEYQTVIKAFDKTKIGNTTLTVVAAVKNEFDLSVLSYEGSDHVQYDLQVLKLPATQTNSGLINEELPETVLDCTVNNGPKSLNLEDGIYKLVITDINAENDKTKPIYIKVTVDSTNSKAEDEIVLKTDFTDIIVVYLNGGSSETETEIIPSVFSAEYIVDIYMDNIGVWQYDTTVNPKPMCGFNYTFIDLDMDGVLEMITSTTDGTMRITYNRYYKVDIDNRKVYELGLFSGFDFGYLGSDNFMLLKNKKTGEYCYWAVDYTRGVDGEYTYSYGTVKYNNDTLTEEALFYEYTAPDSEYYKDAKDRFGLYKNEDWVEVEKSAYDEALEDFMSQHDDMKLSFSSVFGFDFDEASTSEKRTQLLEAYTSFSYDGFSVEEMNIPNESEGSWQQEYKDILDSTDHKYYALYDIDNDGTPELLLNDNAGGFECVVYSYNGKETVEYGNIPCKYGIYEYDGNGIIFTTGGTGILCYMVCRIENEALTAEDTILLLYNIHPSEGIEEYEYNGESVSPAEYEKQENEIKERKIEFSAVTDLSLFGGVAAGVASSAESIGQELTDQLMELYEPDGEYVTFDSETVVKGNKMKFLVRYQMSDERAEEILADGGIPAANTMVGVYTVDTETGDVYDEDDNRLFNLYE